ncbi:MAG TPA: hypothetical protein VJL33_05320, partial [Candidatus Bathyarchaeia archaeon]|nr:hypothetical protein [Candidatus Bathyarchaeia archaeon]
SGQYQGGRNAMGALADGMLVTHNAQDNRIYTFGKGPSAMTVTASPKVSVNGDGVLIEGTVTDISAGTKQNEQAARFPNGVPAVSDESMTPWMEYIYMQRPRPTDVKGVQVTLTILDPNGNTKEIAVTSDSMGQFKKLWIPEVPGEYTIKATFAGSESYWPSYTQTAVGVSEAPPPPAEPEPAPPSMTDTYVVGIGAAIIIVIAIVGALVLLTLRKRP